MQLILGRDLIFHEPLTLAEDSIFVILSVERLPVERCWPQWAFSSSHNIVKDIAKQSACVETCVQSWGGF